jgi:hypothetical protein
MGVSWVDPEDPSQGTTGDPVYPIPDDAYELMPDRVTYDEDGNETSRTPATSNDDLRDVNILAGQAPRDFTDYAARRRTRLSITLSRGGETISYEADS